MGRNTNEIKIIGLTGKFPKYVIAGIGSAFGIWISVLLPYHSNQYLLFSVPVGVICFLSAILQIRKPNQYGKYFLQISASALIALLAYRSISYLFSQFSPYIGALIIFGFVFVHTLPLWNLPVATLVGDELYAPKTWIGKIMFRAILIIAPLAAIGGAVLGKAAAGKSGVSIFIFGMICLYFAFSIPFPGLSRYSKGDQPFVGDKLGIGKANKLASKLSHRQPSKSGKHISHNKRE
jgi:hypothetical protein